MNWYLLYGGSSEDGLGPGVYEGRTTSLAVANMHNDKISANPYSTGYVEVITDSDVTIMPRRSAKEGR